MKNRLNREFFRRDVLEVAPDLIGKYLVRQYEDGTVQKWRITETEAYRGLEDLACHASKGRTNRTEVMYQDGGHIYVYLIYGMYWMLNFVTSGMDVPQAVLIRGLENCYGPGKLTKALGIDKSFYGEDLTLSSRLWVEDDAHKPLVKTGIRIGIDYAGEWKYREWRYFVPGISKHG